MRPGRRVGSGRDLRPRSEVFNAVILTTGPAHGGILAGSPVLSSLAEAGLKDYEAELWYVVIAPAGLSPELTQRINSQIVRIVKSPEMQKKLADQGARPVGSTPAETAAFMKAESEKWGKVIKDANIQGE